jgi:membrane protein YdbS with pleckstrin-like domain
MSFGSFELKRSPFVFLKALVLIIALFAFLPIAVDWLFGIEATYTASGLNRSLPYDFLMTLLVTGLELLIILLYFFAWYVTTYHVTEEEIIQSRGGLMGEHKIAETQQIRRIDIEQGFLARRFNYGTLVLRDWANEKLGQIHNVASPALTADQIQELVDPPALTPSELIGSAPQELVAGGEGQYVEFKSSLMWDYRQERVNKDLYEPVMKNVTAFLNSRGGILLIGVADDGAILGLDSDLHSLKQPDLDHWELVFNNAFNAMIGVQYRRFVELTFPHIEDKVICAVRVRPATKPAYLSQKNTEYFYIRAGNGTQPLSLSKATEYILDHFEE